MKYLPARKKESWIAPRKKKLRKKKKKDSCAKEKKSRQKKNNNNSPRKKTSRQGKNILAHLYIHTRMCVAPIFVSWFELVRIWSMHWKVKSEKVFGVLLKCIATSQVFLIVFMDNFWFLKLTLNSVIVEPTECTKLLISSINSSQTDKAVRKKKRHIKVCGPSHCQHKAKSI